MTPRTAPAAASNISGTTPTGGLREAETWLFDLDNTLYPLSCNLFKQVEVRIRDFVCDLLDLEPDQAFTLQKEYLRDYGTTLRGLMNCHDVDPAPYLDMVHEIDLSAVIANPALDAALSALPGRKVIFTNADAGHTQRVLDRIGICHHFDGVFDIVEADYRPKPDPEIYDFLVNRYGIDPTRSVMVEDMARNLQPAADMGMTTVWVKNDNPWGSLGADGDHIHHAIDDLVDWLEGLEPVAT